VHFSELVVEQKWIREIDINPLLASPDRLLALDARIVIHDPSLGEAELPRTAIRPYPAQYTRDWCARNGSSITIRAIRPDDEPLMVQFHSTLSNQTIALRYFHAMALSTRVAHERLTRICFIDYDREMVLVAVSVNSHTGAHEIQGVGRLNRISGTSNAEFALLVADQFQGQGLGTVLLEQLLKIGHDEKIEQISGDLLPENTIMRRICEKLGFRVSYCVGDPVISAIIDL
jgi:acetyltransferase